ncbi:hypothetical protein NBZ79_12975 [Sneathiella marina]|uniref:Uncharacterized protein n=1 Tax=Sneathiella marina TaxID=2950108 RepID=A0ABY4VYS7_9PROT|nr:hypothetical protein [Sneathiella marina]USG60087.1 hypothetical protein NBZ79_12975 [Sneathiella marina]
MIAAKWTHELRKETIYCYNKGTYVFDLAPGTVNLIDLSTSRYSKKNSLKDLKGLMAVYPSVSADVSLAKPLARITFEPISIFGENQCLLELEGRPIKILERFDN